MFYYRQVKYAFCSANYSSNELTHCGVDDNLGVNRPVMVNRICDGFVDCPGAVDEDGTLAECQVDNRVNTLYNKSCCETYLVDGVKYSFAGDTEGIPFYYSSEEKLYIIYVNWIKSWYHATSNDTNDFYYYDENSKETPCPPMLDWLSHTIVACLANGPVAATSGLEEFSLSKTYANLRRWPTRPELEYEQSNAVRFICSCFLLTVLFL